MHLRSLLFVLPFVVGAVPPVPAVWAGKVFLSVEEALELAFPEDADVTRRTEYLTEDQLERARDLAEVDVPSAIVHPYVARDAEGHELGVAWFDTHTVRSKRETVMYVVAPDRTLVRIEVLAFAEPLEFMPRANWYAQFLGQRLSPELSLKRGIRGVTGATLTAVGTTDAARRVLALHEVVFPAPEPEPDPEPQPDPGA
ncbi:MAG: FMN-binding protein [Planctomycetota bacterium]